MNAIYIRRKGYTAVLTPHFIQQCEFRESLLPSTILDFQYEVGIMDNVWDKSQEDKTFGFKLGAGFVYGKKKFNGLRDRWELEFISFTPSDKFHTKNLDFALFLEI